MAEIHVQTKRRRVSPGWMWAWLILGILIIAAVVYYVYTNKDSADPNSTQDVRNQRNTPMPGALVPQPFSNSYVMRTIA